MRRRATLWLRAGARGTPPLSLAILAVVWSLAAWSIHPGLAQTDPSAPGGRVRHAQHTQLEPPAPAANPAPAGTRRIRVYTRSDVPIQFEWRRDPQSNQWIAVIEQGVNLIVEGLQGAESVAAGMSQIGVDPGEFSLIDISTDRLVIWASGIEEPDLSGERPLPDNVPLEIYMEGNIVFREGEREVYANQMYYDVNNRIGIVLDAELLTPVPDYEGLLRIKSDVLQQVGPDQFLARNSFITSSRMGRPGYRIQTADAYLEDRQWPAVDPWTGEPVVEHQRLATGRNNLLYLGRVPVFYWPFLATDLEEPSFYVRRARLKNDNVFGTQLLTDWDAYQLFGTRNRPEGTDWDISFDYLSDRGFGHGTTFTYGRDGFLGVPGPASGLLDFWGIQDEGVDNLGRIRRNVLPEKDYRWRLFWRHRQELPGDFQLSAEAGWIADRNFLEQYYEREWDELKDQTTGVELKRSRDNTSWSVTADYRINSFFTQTDWLPRADHFWLGQPLFDRFTWYEHTNVGYARFGTASMPEDPTAFSYLPWETSPGGAPLSVRGERFATRQEIDLPLLLGPVKVVPYALGEFAHWGEDRTGNDLQRFYGQTGVRASLPIWKVNPAVQSDLLNLNGLAHKVVFDVDLSWSDADRNLDELPLYDPLDDDSIEAFRRRFTTTTFGGAVPPRFDERFYALRSGLAGWVTSPVTEIADDLLALRLGARQRWQTKRGYPGRERIIDWIELDTHAVLFPEEDRDNFGRTLGLVDYNFRWHVGDRLTLLSEGAFDFFDDGQQTVTLGGFLNRPPRGSLYAGIHLLEGPFSASVLSLSYSYRMSDKWVSSFGTSVDLGDDGNIGQHLAVTRVGESLLISAGLNVDASRGNVGLHFAIEPRFLPKTRLGKAGGAQIPVAGAYGLE
ncbi:MAG: organic solvent tolerance protein OstA [Planctomycetota bacterium]